VRKCEGPVRQCEGPGRECEGPVRQCEGPGRECDGPGVSSRASKPWDLRIGPSHPQTVAPSYRMSSRFSPLSPRAPKRPGGERPMRCL
jgi:hypothetical protein